MSDTPINEQAACVKRVREAAQRKAAQAPSKDLLRMEHINSLPQPFIARFVGGDEWPIYDIDVETGLPRIDVCGKLQVMHIGDVKLFRDAEGAEHDAESFYSDYEEPDTRALPPEPEPQAVAPGESWRMLEVGEVIQGGDEFESLISKEWRPVSNTVGQSIRTDMPSPFRRRVAPAPTPTAEPLCAKCRAVMTQEIRGHWICWPCDAKDGAELEQVRQQHAEEVARKDRVILGIQAAVRSSGIDPLTQVCSMTDPPNEATTAKAIRMIIAERDARAEEVARLRQQRDLALRQTRDMESQLFAERDEVELKTLCIKGMEEQADKMRARIATLEPDRAAALAAQAELMQQLADIHDLATSSAPAEERMAAIVERTKPHHTPV